MRSRPPPAPDGTGDRAPTAPRAPHPASLAAARALAAATPVSRNRYADLLRALSIVVVVAGHWLMAAPSVDRFDFTLSDLLGIAPWTRWLTWVFQVMPVFFLVGGYANAASWESARARAEGVAPWLTRRLRRLLLPVLPLVAFWWVVAGAVGGLGVGERFFEVGSRVAFVPTWFLATYVGVVLVAPATHVLWRRYGLASFWGLALAAAAVDAVRYAAGVEGVGWANYAFVWLAMHQLGYAWRAGVLAGTRRSLSLGALGAAALVVLVAAGPYPVSMVTVPGPTPSNGSPPTLALLALGVAHGGLLLSIEPCARRHLGRLAVWTVVVAVNATILTTYLWHATVMVVLVGLAGWWDGPLLRLVPDSPGWWAVRPLWLVVLAASLAPVAALAGRVEVRTLAWRDAPLPVWRTVAAAVAVCVGLVALGAWGLGGPLARSWPVLVTLGGCGGLLGFRAATPPQRSASSRSVDTGTTR